MEALRDRTVKIDIPYITNLTKEIDIYEKDFNAEPFHIFILLLILEMASMWSILTRLEEPKKANLTILQKLKLYNKSQFQVSLRIMLKSLEKKLQEKVWMASVLDTFKIKFKFSGNR